nr:MAG TPA: hypothetical protein [Caudoviricetes sp.]
MAQITNHLFRDDFSLLSIHRLPHFPYPHARLLLTHTHNTVMCNTSPV